MGLPREVRRALVLTLTLLALSAMAALARADGELTVTRDEGASQCPDGEQLRRLALASAASLFGGPDLHRHHPWIDQRRQGEGKRDRRYQRAEQRQLLIARALGERDAPSHAPVAFPRLKARWLSVEARFGASLQRPLFG